MNKVRRELSDARPRSYAGCYLGLGMVGCLAAALLGLIYNQQAVWAASLACFGLFCAQAACGYYFSERDVMVVNIAVTDRPLRSTTF